MSTGVAVFPGQGSQRAGMARDFYQGSAEARAVFEESSEALGFDIAAVAFDDGDKLALTEYQQPAILTAEIAMLAALRARFGFQPSAFGGHSLGEYAALVAAGVIPVAVAAPLVRERGRLMQEAVPVGEGAMAAIVRPGLDVALIGRLAAELDVDLANHNSPDQVVVSGPADAVGRLLERVKAEPELARARAIPLKVSAPFHSRYMRPAAERFAPLLERSSASWQAERSASVVSNLSGDFHTGERAALVAALAGQISAPVRWLDCMTALVRHADGAGEDAGTIIEVGPGRPLAGFFKSLGRTVASVTDVDSAESAFAS